MSSKHIFFIVVYPYLNPRTIGPLRPSHSPMTKITLTFSPPNLTAIGVRLQIFASDCPVPLVGPSTITPMPVSDWNGLLTFRHQNDSLLISSIIGHISSEMRTILCKNIISSNSKISVLIDEGTSAGNKSCLTIHLKYFKDIEASPIIVFLDLVELAKTDATTITTAIYKCLDR